jgi:ankyrin repeat protein
LLDGRLMSGTIHNRTHSCVSILAVGLVASIAFGHESDQYSVPVGREFADLRMHFSEMIYEKLAAARDRTNARIRHSLQGGRLTAETARLRSPHVVARAVWTEFPPFIHHVESLELELRSAKVRDRYPGLVIVHQPVFWIYHHWVLLLDFTKFTRLWRSSTIMVDGTYFGTDKFVHFVHMGHIYYTEYRKAVAAGLDEEQASRRAVALGTGDNLFLSENGMLGMLTTGIRSNADLAANYAGLKFYRNLTEEVYLGGERRPPLLVREGLYWRLNDHVHPHSDFFNVFITDHWDEALNPNSFGFGIAPFVREELEKRCRDVRSWYRDEHGRPLTRRQFARIAEELQTYFGEDYGYEKQSGEMVSIAECCFGAQEQPARSGSPEGDASFPENPGYGPSSENSPVAVDAFGRSPLWWAAAKGQEEKVTRLLEQGYDCNRADIDGETPLHAAARWGHGTVAEQLLASGADVNARTYYGLTPLHLAVRELRPETVRTLVEHGAEVNAKDAFGCTPLHDAAARGHEACTRLLLGAGAVPTMQDDYGTTPLHRAAREGNASVVAILLRQGADPAIPNAPGKTAYDEARERGHDAVLRQLFEGSRSLRRSVKAGVSMKPEREGADARQTEGTIVRATSSKTAP